MSLKSEELTDDKRWFLLRAKISQENIKTAFRLFRENGVEPILIKGWAAAKEYPETYMRHFSDIDLCVAPEEFEKSLGLISTDPGKGLNIDLHKGLRHLDTVDWECLFQNSEIVQIDDVGVRILCPEDHLRVLCVHWLTDGGAYKEKLLDIYYLLQNNSDSFDWELCFELINKRRRDWIIKTIAVVHRHHNLEISKLPFAAELDSLPGWFIKALEKEWASETKLKDIHAIWSNKEEFWKQLKKRLRPNPIQATVFMEGNFDESSRLYYQLGSFYLRLIPSLRKSIHRIKMNLQRNKKNV
jgi:hypothetical protein